AAFVGSLLEYASEHPRVMECLRTLAIEWRPSEHATGLDKPSLSVSCETSYIAGRAMGLNTVVGVTNEGDPNVRFFLRDGITQVRLPAADVRAFVLGIFDR